MFQQKVGSIKASKSKSVCRLFSRWAKRGQDGQKYVNLNYDKPYQEGLKLTKLSQKHFGAGFIRQYIPVLTQCHRNLPCLYSLSLALLYVHSQHAFHGTVAHSITCL